MSHQLTEQKRSFDERRQSDKSVMVRISGLVTSKSENASVALDLVQQIKTMNIATTEELRQKKLEGRLKKMSFL